MNIEPGDMFIGTNTATPTVKSVMLILSKDQAVRLRLAPSEIHPPKYTKITAMSLVILSNSKYWRKV